MELSLEQQFNICSFKAQVQGMTREQAQGLLVELYTQMILQESLYKSLLRHKWGFDTLAE